MLLHHQRTRMVRVVQSREQAEDPQDPVRQQRGRHRSLTVDDHVEGALLAIDAGNQRDHVGNHPGEVDREIGQRRRSAIRPSTAARFAPSAARGPVSAEEHRRRMARGEGT